MSADVSKSAGARPAEWPVLDMFERRALGVLVEKAKTTPDAYPLSLNSLVTGCNQKSNRDPVMGLTEEDVEATILSLQKKGLATRITGSGRVERWRHNLYDVWQVDKVELAVLTELLLRGPQTEGELRSRASRMEEIADLDALREILAKLKERKLIVYLTPEGRRGTTVTHGFHDPKELAEQRQRLGEGLSVETAPIAPTPPASNRTFALEEKVATLETALNQATGEIKELRASLIQMQTTMTEAAEELRRLKEALGS